MISNCPRCSRLYDFPSEEAANEPDRCCYACWMTAHIKARCPEAVVVETYDSLTVDVPASRLKEIQDLFRNEMVRLAWPTTGKKS